MFKIDIFIFRAAWSPTQYLQKESVTHSARNFLLEKSFARKKKGEGNTLVDPHLSRKRETINDTNGVAANRETGYN